MKKTYWKNSLGIALILAQLPISIASADCVDTYLERAKKLHKRSDKTFSLIPDGETIAVPAGLILGALASPHIWVALVPPLTYALVTAGVAKQIGKNGDNAEELVFLINEASDFEKSGTSPGELLSKLHRKVSKKKPEITMSQLASAIVRANEDGSLCSNRKTNMRKVKRAIKRGEIEMVAL